MCCGSPSQPGNKPVKRKRLDIDFLYLDLSTCTRCQGTDSTLSESVEEVCRVLEATGTQVNLHKIHVKSEAQAAELGFIVSPTIRVNGKDIQMGFKESRCESCGTLCDCEEGVSCREWEYQGQWYVVPPKGLIIEAILKEVYGDTKDDREVTPRTEAVPVNLKRFFDSSRD